MPLYELEEGTSRKFYRVELHGTRVHLNWGRIGSEGAHQILSLGNEAQARAEYQRQLNERLDRGYRLVVDEGVPHDPASLEKARLERTGGLSASPRFLFVHAKRRRFAWVEARGADLVHAEGATTEPDVAEPTVKACGSAAAAQRARDDLIARWMARGYELDTFGKKERPKKRAPKVLVPNEPLERAIAEDPYDDAAWAVLEDWILQTEDARADLVRAAKGQAAQTEAHHALLPIVLGPRREPILRALDAHQWRAGYLVECAYREPVKSGDLTAAAFYQAPATRLLRALDLDAPLGPHLVHIAQAPCHRSLRRLQSAGWRTNVANPIDATLLPPHLVQLRSNAGYAPLIGDATLPHLEELAIVTSQPEILAGWVRQQFLALRVLTLTTPRASIGTLVDLLARLFEKQMAPQLEALTVFTSDVDIARALTDAVDASPLRAQLHALAVS